MRRFYKEAAVVEGGGGFALELDGRPVKTPARAAMAVPGRALAEAIAQEWRAQGEKLDPHSMPMTGLSNAAIDRVSPDPASFAAGLAQFGESDLLCYRAEGPAPLAARQAEHWDPVLGWARRRYDIEVKVTQGVIHTPQPAATVARLHRAVAARPPFELAGLSPLVTVSGSLIIALALAEGELELEPAWSAATVDEAWQLEKWGEDTEAVHALANRRLDFEAGARFLELLRTD
jgi:chaperone required for assembly of F1-ATPase